MEKKLKKKKKKKLVVKDPKRLVTFFAIIILLFLFIIGKNNKTKSKEYISLIINNEDVTEDLEDEIIIGNDIEYLSFDDIKSCIDSNIYKEDKKIILSSDKKIAVLELNKNDIEINGSVVQINGQAFQTEQGKIYLPISELQNVYDIEFLYIPEYKNIVIDSFSKKLEKAYVTKGVSIKEEMKTSSKTMEKVEKGNWVIYVTEQNGWAKVRSQNGNLGYVKKKNLTNFTVQREEMQKEDNNLEKMILEQDITKKNIEKYENRKKVIEQLLKVAVEKKKNSIKIIYKKNIDTEAFKRFKIEATAILKECGITVLF